LLIESLEDLVELKNIHEQVRVSKIETAIQCEMSPRNLLLTCL